MVVLKSHSDLVAAERNDALHVSVYLQIMRGPSRNISLINSFVRKSSISCAKILFA